MSQVVSLSKALHRDVSEIGGKALHLAELATAGFAVPPAFVVTADAFSTHFSEVGAGDLLEPNARPDPQRLAELREGSLALALTDAITAAHHELAQQIGIPAAELVCAVRSSGADEDSAQTSFAGQHATYYYTRESDLCQRVLDCWLSCWASHATHYRQANEVGGPRMAVLIQQMVVSEISGVAFTRDPTQPDQLVVESCWGLGAALVDGRVTPDRYCLANGDHRLVSSKIGTKRHKVTEDLIEPEGTRLESVPRHLQRESTLNPERLKRVVDLAVGCEAHYGEPQDVEWAFAGDELYLLQSRPITTAPPANDPVEGRWVIFQPIVENFTEALTPLTVDIVRRIIPPMGRFIDGRFYLDFDLVRRLIPLDLGDAELVNLARLQPSDAASKVNRRRLWLPVTVLLAGYLSWGTLMVRTRHLPSRALAGFKARCAAVLVDERLDAAAAARRLLLGVSPLAPAGHLAFQVNMSSVRYFFLLDGLRALLKRFAPDFDPGLIGSLCTGSSDMMSTRMIEDLRNLAASARDCATVRHLFETQPPEGLPARLAQEATAEPFLRGLEGYLSKYGHRGNRELELAAPRWQEDPTPLLMMIRGMLAAEDLQAPMSPTGTERAMNRSLRNGFVRRLAGWLVRRIRYYAALRENTRYYHVMALTTIRQKILELERELIAANVLRCADDIFYLTWDEVTALQSGTSLWKDTNAVVRQRRVAHLKSSDRLPPASFGVLDAEVAPGNEDLTGQCASPGNAEGIARVIFDPSADDELQAGEILIAPYTDPAWTPLFLNAAAIVVEVGSYLSHAGTVAREYGVPCIVGVAGCTRNINNGQRLRVDASNGFIQILADAAAPVSADSVAS